MQAIEETSTITIEKVVITGGRNFTDGAQIEADLRMLMTIGLNHVAHGGNGVPRREQRSPWCPNKSADALAQLAIDRLDLRWTIYWAEWQAFGKAAGHRRNTEMLDDERPPLVLAYPDPASRGTWHCVQEALKRGIPCAIWAPFIEPGMMVPRDAVHGHARGRHFMVAGHDRLKKLDALLMRLPI